MAGSSRAVTAADASRGFSCTSLPKDYRLILPPLPTGEGLRRTLVLHCDIAARPYGINDFRKPLKELGIIQEVSGIGAYQMSHVWLLNMKTDEAKKIVLDAGLLSVKDRPCVVVDPERQEVRLKLHWVAFDVNAETVRRAFREYGEVKEVISDKWRDEDFEGVESTTRFVRLLLKEGVTTDRIPHQMRLGSGMALVVVPGRAPLCLRCRNTGHIRRDCRVPRCAGCRAFGHEQADCTRSYASAASRATNADHSELLMDEEEAERAAASKAGEEASHAVATSEEKTETPKQDAGTDENTVVGTPTPRRSTQMETQHKAEPVIGSDATSDMDTVEATPVKRRLNEGDAASQQRLTQEDQGQWRVAGSKKSRGAGRLRSSSLSRGGDGTTP
ncbi:hypothetical protein HPB51_007356 [Rhipicephalus microplus]|uniref:CCHC-type domain-containing protein n=1 Tax=Rhipicephalus microplus TaxID=6941 RepID=A0A9J6DFZ0_RHIMP|nr:hypothetical protein HPB51_011786 [Rhipicephalus microplus]KAH8035808.1 hypothetical protein HPB51_008635 [Rhipicephalus microplus]KAH8036933.1 hypothetical protein HPB51_007356 [Rhipicephalus microplus]